MSQIPWGNNQNLNENQFYNRNKELTTFKSFLETTSTGNPPDILLTGLRGIGKTVFLKKIKKELEKDYLVIYMDFSQAGLNKNNKTTIKSILEYYCKKIILECNDSKIKNINKKIEKFFKTNDFFIKDFTHIKGVPIPIFGAETNNEDLMDFVLTLPEKIYEKNKDNIKGIIIFIDEFQTIRRLNRYTESFLWKLRSYIQNQRHIAYVFSGSMSIQDNLITEIASKQGVFGGRMLTFNLRPFSKQTVNKYLSEKTPELTFTDKGFERFYKCTSGIPAYINIFARILPKNSLLDEKDVINEFNESIYYIASHLINIWAGLSYREQTIITSLLDKPLRRIDIAEIIGISSGSLGQYLINLQNLSLIGFTNNKYFVSEPLIKKWLKSEYMNKGDYPYNFI